MLREKGGGHQELSLLDNLGRRKEDWGRVIPLLVKTEFPWSSKKSSSDWPMGGMTRMVEWEGTSATSV